MDPSVLETLRRYWRGAGPEDGRRQEACLQLSQHLAARRNLAGDFCPALDALGDEVLAEALEALARGNPVVSTNLRALGPAEGVRRPGPTRGRGPGNPGISEKNALKFYGGGAFVSVVNPRPHGAAVKDLASAPPSAISLGDLTPAPDALLRIWSTGPSGGPELRFALEAKGERQVFPPARLRKSPDTMLAELLQRLDRLKVKPGAPGKLPDQVADIGATLFEQIVPGELGEALWQLADGSPSLLVVTDEPWIPWELVQLQPPGGGPRERGPFLCRAFEMARWLGAHLPPGDLPLKHIGLVVSESSDLEASREEGKLLLAQADSTRRVERVPAREAELRRNMADGTFDAWHFSGHGTRGSSDPNLAEIALEEKEYFTPMMLSGATGRFGERRPFVFLNGCYTGRPGETLTGIGGWAQQFLKAGAGAFLGAWWQLSDSQASRFARHFYTKFLSGTPLAAAVHMARKEIETSGDASWLAYAVYGHPLARCGSSQNRGARHPHP